MISVGGPAAGKRGEEHVDLVEQAGGVGDQLLAALLGPGVAADRVVLGFARGPWEVAGEVVAAGGPHVVFEIEPEVHGPGAQPGARASGDLVA
jgi:hypothetical protein